MSEMNVPVIMAGEVLEFMVENPRPTRTEICHLYDLIDKGYSGIVLSDETAYGKYPEEIINFLEEMRLI
jgi:pyruvate kinase